MTSGWTCTRCLWLCYESVELQLCSFNYSCIYYLSIPHSKKQQRPRSRARRRFLQLVAMKAGKLEANSNDKSEGADLDRSTPPKR